MTTENEDFVLGEEVTTRAKSRSRGDTVVLSVRLSLEEFSGLEALSTATGKTLSQVVREAIGERLRTSRLSEPRVTVFFGGVTTSIGVPELQGRAVVIEPKLEAGNEDPIRTYVEIGP